MTATVVRYTLMILLGCLAACQTPTPTRPSQTASNPPDASNPDIVMAPEPIVDWFVPPPVVVADLPLVSPTEPPDLWRNLRNSFQLDQGLLEVEDDKLTIYIQHQKPTDPGQTANWLPAPQSGFRFTPRFYGPKYSLIDGTYKMPQVQRVS